jgi:hypothetical protein
MYWLDRNLRSGPTIKIKLKTEQRTGRQVFLWLVNTQQVQPSPRCTYIILMTGSMDKLLCSPQ